MTADTAAIRPPMEPDKRLIDFVTRTTAPAGDGELVGRLRSMAAYFEAHPSDAADDVFASVARQAADRITALGANVAVYKAADYSALATNAEAVALQSQVATLTDQRDAGADHAAHLKNVIAGLSIRLNAAEAERDTERARADEVAAKYSDLLARLGATDA